MQFPDEGSKKGAGKRIVINRVCLLRMGRRETRRGVCMKKSVLLIFLVLLCVSSQAQSDSLTGGLSGFKPIYFITGIGDDQVKMQLSFKYDIFYPFLSKIGLYMGYTQLMLWNLYSFSNPFKTIDFNPDFFWRFESKNNFAGDIDIPGFDYVQLGLFEHISNGEDGAESRGYDRSYVQFQFSTPFTLNFGINLKVFYCYGMGDNTDINDYIGNYEAMVFFRILDDSNREYEAIYVRFASGGGIFGFDFSKGFQEIGVRIRPIVARFRPYIQFYHGYNESVIDYNRLTHNNAYNQDFSIRIGIVIE
jgi:phospholipase A1